MKSLSYVDLTAIIYDTIRYVPRKITFDCTYDVTL